MANTIMLMFYTRTDVTFSALPQRPLRNLINRVWAERTHATEITAEIKVHLPFIIICWSRPLLLLRLANKNRCCVAIFTLPAKGSVYVLSIPFTCRVGEYLGRECDAIKMPNHSIYQLRIAQMPCPVSLCIWLVG